MAELTFLMNSDPAGSPNQFYTLAKQFFVAAGATVIDAPANGQTLEGVFKTLSELSTPQATINLVSQASGFASMACPVTEADQTAGRTTMTVDDLRDALTAKSPAPPGPGVITDETKIVIYGCDVGRPREFLTFLSGLFGDPGEILAPRRLGVFTSDGTTVQYRQAQTWSLVRKPPLVLDGQATPTGDWPDYRTKFVDDAHQQFGRIAIPDEPIGEDRLRNRLTTAAQDATTALGPTFFLEEGIDILPTDSQTAAEAAASLKRRSNGDPVTALPKSALELDDAAVVTTVGPADAFDAGTKFEIRVALLAQVIDEEVLIAEGPDYVRVTASPGLAPAKGPGGGGGGAGAGAISAELQAIIDELLAGGVPQAEIDALLALIPQADATEAVVTTEAPDEEELSVGEISEYAQPDIEELV